MGRKPNPSEVSDAAWAVVAPYLTLRTAEAPQRVYSLREVCNSLRWLVRAGAPGRLMPHDLPAWEAVSHQTPRWLNAGIFEAIGHALRLTLRLATSREEQPEAKKGLVLLPRRWVVERRVAWTARCRRLARDGERLSKTLAGWHVLAFAFCCSNDLWN